MFESLLVLCMVIIGSPDYNCEWNIHYIEDANDFETLMKEIGVYNEGYTIAGITLFDTKLILINKEYANKVDNMGLTPLKHEFLHAFIYENWLVSPENARQLAVNWGLPLNYHEPYRWHG